MSDALEIIGFILIILFTISSVMPKQHSWVHINPPPKNDPPFTRGNNE